MTDAASVRLHDVVTAVHEGCHRSHRVTAHKTMVDTLTVSVSTLTILQHHPSLRARMNNWQRRHLKMRSKSSFEKNLKLLHHIQPHSAACQPDKEDNGHNTRSAPINVYRESIPELAISVDQHTSPRNSAMTAQHTNNVRNDNRQWLEATSRHHSS